MATLKTSLFLHPSIVEDFKKSLRKGLLATEGTKKSLRKGLLATEETKKSL